MAKTKHFNLIESLLKISQVAKKENWIKSYDKALDYFYWERPRLSKNTQLIKMSNEMLFYVSPKGLIEDIGVEYLTNNFIQHNPNHKNLPKIFTKKIEEEIFTTIDKQKESEAQTFKNFTNDLTDDAYQENFKNNRTPHDIEELVNTAITN